jgi:glyoxylase-like metal-dependent hydrolase (beta-lactamase superfamily II)
VHDSPGVRNLRGMRIHHLSCGTLCPIGGKLMHERTASPLRAELCCHCLLIESGDGLVLVDTGLGMRDVEAPRERLAPFFRFECKPRRDPDSTAVRQVERLGFAPEDVRHIVMTHLDFDHAGGLDDFPAAEVHVSLNEAMAATHPRGPVNVGRFRPEQWAGSIDRWTLHRGSGEEWFGFESVRAVGGSADEILLVPLRGHTLGHCGVAVRDDSGWLLNAGDAYFYRHEMDVEGPWCTPGLRFYQVQMEMDRRARLANQRRLRELRREHGGEVRVFCSHDPVELEMFAAEPAAALGPEIAASAPY